MRLLHRFLTPSVDQPSVQRARLSMSLNGHYVPQFRRRSPQTARHSDNYFVPSLDPIHAGRKEL